MKQSLLQKLMPRQVIKQVIKKYFPIWFYRRLENKYKDINPFANDEEFGSYQGNSQFTLGIIREIAQYHQNYIAACREMGVSYKVLDISGTDWIDVINNSSCDAFLVWPSAITTALKNMYDERLKVMVDSMNKIIFPSYGELWMWESKRRMRDWLSVNGYPVPRTWIFYSFDQAERFLQTADFPLVFKTDHGDCSEGVEIVHSKAKAYKITKKAFSSGQKLPSSHPCDRQWGSVVFQEYMKDAVEWRVIKIGDSYFGYMKKKLGDYASGSHAGVYADVPRVLLDLIRELSETHNFMSVSLDILLNPDGRPYIIELQSIFGCTKDPRKLRVNGIAGRYVYDPGNNEYPFQEGIFDQNICCNLRVKYVLKMLAQS